MQEKSSQESWKRKKITESSKNILVYPANYGEPSVNNFRLAISLVIVLGNLWKKEQEENIWDKVLEYKGYWDEKCTTCFSRVSSIKDYWLSEGI